MFSSQKLLIFAGLSFALVSGGVGKTTMAVAIARDLTIRAAFERIAWISVGQTPQLMELQRVLFIQLTGNALPVKHGATADSQSQDLQAACVGKHFLLILGST